MLVSINMFKTLLQPTAVYNEKLRIASNGFHLLGYLKFVNLPNVIDFVSEYWEYRKLSWKRLTSFSFL